MKFEVRNGYFHYKNRPMLLEDISFTVPEGELLAILGPNGIGKTTLLKCMMGFLPWKSGHTLIDSENIGHLSARTVWKNIAYVPQAKGSTFSFTGLEMALLGRGAHLGTFAQPGIHDIAIAEEALNEIGIMYLRDKLCNQMSGGELQMVLIARALTTHPRLLVLDEPESGLDFRNQLIILNLLDRLVHEKNLSAIINTHYPSHALKIADSTLMLGRERQYFYGATEEVITVENMRTAFDVDVLINSVHYSGKTYEDIIPVSVASREHTF